MYTTATLTSLLLASVASASPLMRRQNATSTTGQNNVDVVLENTAMGLRSTSSFEHMVSRQSTGPDGENGPFTTVNILLDDDAPNQDLRCEIMGEDGLPLIATRGANVDITFSDGTPAAAGGAWTFQDPDGVYVSEIACDPALLKAPSPDDLQVRVFLSNQATETGSQTTFENPAEREVQTPVGSSGPFQTVELITGALFPNQELRCKIFDENNRAIRVIRGENNDTTFTDGDGGEWTLEHESEVSRIVCNPRFVANPL